MKWGTNLKHHYITILAGYKKINNTEQTKMPNYLQPPNLFQGFSHYFVIPTKLFKPESCSHFALNFQEKPIWYPEAKLKVMLQLYVKTFSLKG